ncbi:MAG TPA: alpha/beta hydrolase [Polyangiales bacterium]|nr:alpha/beta hydrolase [Polyangiales bacterium]
MAPDNSSPLLEQSASDRVGYLKALGACALLWLLVSHATLGLVPGAERAFAVLFVLLGYWLQLDSRRWLRRPFQHLAQLAWRSLPLYYLALLGTLLLLKLVPGLNVPEGANATPWDASAPAFSSGALLSHGLLIHNWFPRWMYRINPTLWAAAAGMQGCVLCVAVFLPLWRRRGPLPVLALGCAPLLLAPERKAWFVTLIALGVCAAGERARRGKWGSVSLALGAACLATACALPKNELASDLLAGLTTAALLVHLEQHPGSSWLQRIAPLGRAGYSVLLTYLPVLALCRIWSDSAALGIAAAFIAGAVFHVVLERRFLGTLRPLVVYARPLRRALGVALALVLCAASVERVFERRDQRTVEQRASYLTLGDQRIRYRLHRGDPSVPTVVFLSAMGPLEEFDAVASKLAPHVPTLAYDRCNMGFSRANNTGCTPAQAAQELARVLDALSLPRVLLIGYSVSAMQVRAFVGARPEQAAGAIFLDPRSPEAVNVAATELNWGGRHAVDVWLAGKLLRSLVGYQRVHDSIALPAIQPAQVSAKHAWAALRAFRAFESSHVADFDRAAFTGIPAALISVSDPGDRFGRRMLAAQRAAIERAASQRVLLLHDVPHWELLTDPRATRRIADFIQAFR